MKKLNLKKITFILVFLNVIFFFTLNYSTYFKPHKQVEANELPNSDEVEKKDVYLNIMVSNRVTYEMCKSIIGDKHNLILMSNDEFEITNDAIRNAAKMDLFIYMGKNNEPWANEFIEDITKDKVGIINISRGTKTLSIDKGIIEKEENINKYYWLSPSEYKISLYNIKKAMEEKDIENKDYYKKNYTEAIKTIDENETSLNETVKEIKDRKVILLGSDLEYLAQYLGLNYIKFDNMSNKVEFEKFMESVKKDTLDEENNNQNKYIYMFDKKSIEKYIYDYINTLKDDKIELDIKENKGYIEYLQKVNDSFRTLIQI